MSEHATQLHFEAMGHGRVALIATRGVLGDVADVNGPMVERKILEILAYPQQGGLIGRPPIDEWNARQLNEELEPLNRKLAELAS